MEDQPRFSVIYLCNVHMLPLSRQDCYAGSSMFIIRVTARIKPLASLGLTRASRHEIVNTRILITSDPGNKLHRISESYPDSHAFLNGGQLAGRAVDSKAATFLIQKVLRSCLGRSITARYRLSSTTAVTACRNHCHPA